MADSEKQSYAALGTIAVQPKLFRGLNFAALLEDIVVNDKFRGKGLGTSVIQCLCEVSQALGCYKAILYAKEDLKEFYLKTGLDHSGVLMSKYFDKL